MNILFYTLVLTPLLALIISYFFSNEKEKAIFNISIVSVAINYVSLIIMGIIWAVNGFESIYLEGPVIYHTGKADFVISFLLDGYSLVYLFTATFLTGIIVIFSKNYIHREKGYKRFFNNIKFFYFGLVLVLLAGNLETIFLGWEVLGVTSFFLIGFYRDRYLPVKNALKVVSLYRIADVALLLGIWLSHHYFGFSVNFQDLDGLHSPHNHIINESIYLYLIPGLFLLAAMVKSAQFPFSSWLPRAMEGPTTSSSIFYGSLSAHIGVFLLIRTAPFWEGNYWFHFIIGGIGLLTVFVASFSAKVQSTIKTQIAYSSLTQIGLMFVEISLGLYWLAIIHFIGNAMLRTHQLLISPSILSYKIHDQFFHFNPPAEQGKKTFWDKVKLTLYILSIKEFNLDTFMYRFLWNPLKKAGNLFNFLSPKLTFGIFIPLFLVGLYAIYHRDKLPIDIENYYAVFFALISFILILKAFVKRKSVINAWGLLILNQLFLSLAFAFNEKFGFEQIHLYLSGIIASGIIGFLVFNRLKKKGKDINLNTFQGHIYEFPRLGFLFAIACLGISGFPITPTFIGEDILMGHVHESQPILLILLTLSFVLDGLVVFRTYSRLFLGQHKSAYHDFAYKSS